MGQRLVVPLALQRLQMPPSPATHLEPRASGRAAWASPAHGRVRYRWELPRRCISESGSCHIFWENSSEGNTSCSAPVTPFTVSFQTQLSASVLWTLLKAFWVFSKIWVFCGFILYLHGEASVESDCAMKRLKECRVVAVACGGLTEAHRLPSPCGEVF